MAQLEQGLEKFREAFAAVRAEIGKVLVGQDDVVEKTLIALFAGGHCLLEGVPGLGKTLLVRTLSRALDLEYSRIQFTPDLMPADIIGTRIVIDDESGGRRFEFRKGPIFGQIILADEINRATPKTQSALLEAMQEHEVTVGRESHRLDEPFLVMATQNPLEMDGTYPLPEAQLDRFLFKITLPFPSREELSEVVVRTIDPYDEQPQKVLDGEKIVEIQSLLREVVSAPHVRDYAVRLLLATHPENPEAPEGVKRYIRYGGSPRGVQALIIGAKIRAALAGRVHIGFDDVVNIVHPALRHRVIMNFEGEAEGKSADAILDEVVAVVPEVAEGEAVA